MDALSPSQATRGWATNCALRVVHVLAPAEQESARRILNSVLNFAAGHCDQQQLDRLYHEAAAWAAAIEDQAPGSAAQVAAWAVREAANRLDVSGLATSRWTRIALVRAEEETQAAERQLWRLPPFADAYMPPDYTAAPDAPDLPE